jgi:hypothetical protein
VATEWTTVERVAGGIALAGGVFGVAALVCAYNTTVYPNSSLGLGIAAAGLSLGAAICSVPVALLFHPGEKPTHADSQPSNHPSERATPT